MLFRTVELKEVEANLRKQFTECTGLKFFEDYKKQQVTTEDIPDLKVIIEIVGRYEKELAKQRLALDLRILEYRLSDLSPDEAGQP